eukprot:1402722-Amphidinium_carterae.3
MTAPVVLSLQPLAEFGVKLALIVLLLLGTVVCVVVKWRMRCREELEGGAFTHHVSMSSLAQGTPSGRTTSG